MLCSRCLSLLRPVGPPVCALCGAPTLWPVARCRECTGRRLAFASARAAVVYAGPARPLVAAWKEHGLRRAAALAARLVVAAVPRPAADVIAYIPPDPYRLLRRGDHPARRLAHELARLWGIEVEPLLARADVRGRTRQAGLARDERARNLRGAFAATKPAPARVALVDDVYTTGATAAEAAARLAAAGAEHIEVVTFARTVRR